MFGEQSVDIVDGGIKSRFIEKRLNAGRLEIVRDTAGRKGNWAHGATTFQTSNNHFKAITSAGLKEGFKWSTMSSSLRETGVKWLQIAQFGQEMSMKEIGVEILDLIPSI